MDIAKLRAEGRIRPTARHGSVVAIGTTQTELLPANPHRVSWLLVNDEANNARVVRARTGVVSSTRGVPLDANGGTIAADFEQDGLAVGLSVYGAMATGAGNLYLEEYEVF